MRITETQIRRVMPNAQNERVKEFVKSFNEWCDTFGITTPIRVAMYVAQVAHETGELKWLEEIASGKQYEGRKDLGNTQPGDGVRFKGRGYLQCTGRRNYQSYKDSGYCVGDLMAHPEWLSKQPGCQKASMWFWKKNNLNRWADADDAVGLSKRINGGTNGMAQRLYYTRVAKKVFGVG